MTDVRKENSLRQEGQHERTQVCKQAALCSYRRWNLGQSANIQVAGWLLSEVWQHSDAGVHRQERERS